MYKYCRYHAHNFEYDVYRVYTIECRTRFFLKRNIQKIGQKIYIHLPNYLMESLINNEPKLLASFYFLVRFLYTFSPLFG